MEILATENDHKSISIASPSSSSPAKLLPTGIRRGIDQVEAGNDELLDSTESTWKKIKLDASLVNENDNDSMAASSDRGENDASDASDSDSNDDDDDDDGDSSSDNDSEFSSFTGLSDMSGQQWKPKMKPSLWIQKQMLAGANPRELLAEIMSNGAVISQDLSDMTLWRILVNMMSEPPRRHKLRNVNTMEDVLHLLNTCQNIMVLTGAGVSVSCGIPDFRSSDGIYSRLAKDFPGLPDPQAMFDINYFHRDPRPFFKFAREIYPGQFKPSTCHRFIKMLERKGKLLRNYTQNIDTLEQVAGIDNVIECHGSFATASCTRCKHKTTADTIRDDIFAQRIPMCPKCKEQRGGAGDEETTRMTAPDTEEYSRLVDMGIMKPDIVFFGEGLPETFHASIARDKDKCDLLIVIGSSLKVHPVALIPRSISPNVPQILINRERLANFEFDVELLGDSDTIIAQLCHLLGDDYTELSAGIPLLNESRQLKPMLSASMIGRKSLPASIADDDDDDDDTGVEDIISTNDDTTTIDSQSLTSGGGLTSNNSFCDSGFESTSSSSNVGNITSASSSSASVSLNLNGNTISNISSTFCNGRKSYHKTHHNHRSSMSVSQLKRRKEHTSSSSSESDSNIFSGTSSSVSPLYSRLETSEPRLSGIPPDSADSSPDVLKTNEKETPDRMENTGEQRDTEVKSGGDDDCFSPQDEWRTATTADCMQDASIAEQLYDGTYYRHSRGGIYVFSGAQVYLTPELELSSCDSDDDDGDDEADDIDVAHGMEDTGSKLNSMDSSSTYLPKETEQTGRIAIIGPTTVDQS